MSRYIFALLLLCVVAAVTHARHRHNSSGSDSSDSSSSGSDSNDSGSNDSRSNDSGSHESGSHESGSHESGSRYIGSHNSEETRKCPQNEEWDLCGKLCEPSCGNQKPTYCAYIACSKSTAACRCEQHYVRKGNHCVKPIQCETYNK